MGESLELYQSIKERFRSPVIGTFITSWLITNWKIPYITFFVNESALGGTTKLEAVINIIDSYDCWLLKFLYFFIIPFASVCFMIYAYPWLQNHIQQWRIKHEGATQLFRHVSSLEFQNAKNEFELYKSKYRYVDDNSVKELQLRIINDDITIDKIFLGHWDIDVSYRINQIHKHISFSDCHFTQEYCICNDQTIFDFGTLKKDTELNFNNFNASLELRFLKGLISDSVYEYNVRIKNRGHIEMNYYGPKDIIKINLRWAARFD